MRLAQKMGLTDNEIYRVVSPLTKTIGLVTVRTVRLSHPIRETDGQMDRQ